jgi:hypothetical protein
LWLLLWDKVWGIFLATVSLVPGLVHWLVTGGNSFPCAKAYSLQWQPYWQGLKHCALSVLCSMERSGASFSGCARNAGLLLEGGVKKEPGVGKSLVLLMGRLLLTFLFIYVGWVQVGALCRLCLHTAYSLYRTSFASASPALHENPIPAIRVHADCEKITLSVNVYKVLQACSCQ